MGSLQKEVQGLGCGGSGGTVQRLLEGGRYPSHTDPLVHSHSGEGPPQRYGLLATSLLIKDTMSAESQRARDLLLMQIWSTQLQMSSSQP